jgi:hypothetical protein
MGGHMMERRTFMALVSGCLLAAQLAAEAQQAGARPHRHTGNESAGPCPGRLVGRSLQTLLLELRAGG